MKLFKGSCHLENKWHNWDVYLQQTVLKGQRRLDELPRSVSRLLALVAGCSSVPAPLELISRLPGSDPLSRSFHHHLEWCRRKGSRRSARSRLLLRFRYSCRHCCYRRRYCCCEWWAALWFAGTAVVSDPSALEYSGRRIRWADSDPNSRDDRSQPWHWSKQLICLTFLSLFPPPSFSLF